MNIIAMIMLLVPGLITLVVSGKLDMASPSGVAKSAVYWLINCFVIIVIAYQIMMIITSGNTFSFSGSYYGSNIYYSIFDMNVVRNYSALAIVVGIGLGLAQRGCFYLASLKKHSKGQNT